jgi:phosphate transport system substrate-binding protein
MTRSIFIQLNRPPGTPLKPPIKEFLRFVLSRQGQTAVRVHEEYVPLTRDELDRQRGALD